MGDSRAALPRPLIAALAIGGALLLAQLVVLVISLGQISSTEDHVAATDAKATAAFDAARSIEDEASALLRRAAPLAERAGPAVRDASDLFIVLSRGAEDLLDALDRFPALDAGLRAMFTRLLPVLDAIDPPALEAAVAQLDPTLSSVGALASQLASGERLAGTLDQAADLLARIDRRHLVRRAVQSDRTLRDVLAVQRKTLSVQRRAVAVLLNSLRVQLQSLDHVRSLDEKTGGDILSP